MRKLWTLVVFIILASLDNAALAMIPNMLLPISEDLGVSEAALGAITATVILVTAITAVGWGYWGDRSSRKRLLFWGTVIWAGGTAASAAAPSYLLLFGAQIATAAGLGSIASVGFSVVSDFVAPRRRGLAMSFWGLSQGAGGLVGGLVASQLGAGDWRRPMWVIAIVGAAFGFLYLTTFEPARGAAEPELAGRAEELEEVITWDQVPSIVRRPTNIWLIAQGFTAQFAYGSLLWVPLLYQSKVVAEGYDTATATKVGGIFAAIFQLAAITSIVAGWLGDRWQRRNPRGRATLSMIGILGAIPFFLLFFFVPLRELAVTEGGSTGQLAGEVLRSLVTNPFVALAFGASIIAIVLTSADSPNWFALIADVNLPEHRGTVFGLGNLSNGVGRSIGNGLTGLASATLITTIAAPLNYAVALALFQAFFIPTGYCYWKAAHTAPSDIDDVRQTLSARAGAPRSS